MARRLLSFLTAVVATTLGYLAAWTGGAATAMGANTISGGFDPTGLPLVVLGLALLAVAALTVVFSSAGVIVVGAIHLLFGAVALALPPTGFAGGFSPAYVVIRQLSGVSETFADGLYYSVPTGFGMLAGVVLLVSGLAARSRRTLPGTGARVIAGVVALVLGVPGVLLVLAGGGGSFRRTVALLQPAAPLDLVAIVAGFLLVAVAVSSVRWSSAGVVVLGVIVAALGAAFLVSSARIAGSAAGLSHELAAGIQAAGATGNVLIVGVLLVAAGFGVRLRARRAAPREPMASGSPSDVATATSV